MKDFEDYRDEENDTYLALRPRVIDLKEIGYSVIPWLTVESIVLREEKFKDIYKACEERHYVRGYAFDVEIESSRIEEKQIGVIEGTFFNFDKMKADGIPFRHQHYGANLSHVKILKILQNQDASFGERNSLNIFEIDKILINAECRDQNIGTAAMLILADAIEYHFNQKVGILVVNPAFMLVENDPWSGFSFDNDEAENKRQEARIKAENLQVIKDRERLKEFFEGLGFEPITKNGYLYIDTRQEMADATEDRCASM